MLGTHDPNQRKVRSAILPIVRCAQEGTRSTVVERLTADPNPSTSPSFSPTHM
jgi:hypothetical protein